MACNEVLWKFWFWTSVGNRCEDVIVFVFNSKYLSYLEKKRKVRKKNPEIDAINKVRLLK